MENKVCLIIEDQKETAEFLIKTVMKAFPLIQVVHKCDLKSSVLYLDELIKKQNNLLMLAIVDLGLPDGSGIEFISVLKNKMPNVPAVVATVYDDDSFLFKALSAGAFGYLLKTDDQAFLVDALQRITKNDPPLSPSIARRLLEHFSDESFPDNSDLKLSPRELETLILISKGLTVGEVAAQLKLSSLTVAGYVKTIYQKLHVSNRAELVREATRRGLV